jgi:hypothetical protein
MAFSIKFTSTWRIFSPSQDSTRSRSQERPTSTAAPSAERAVGERPEIDGLEAELVAPREAEQRGDLALHARELDEDDLVLFGIGRVGLTSELLREAPSGRDRVADLVRHARGQLADGRQLLGVRDRALGRDGALEQLGRVEDESELAGEALERG